MEKFKDTVDLRGSVLLHFIVFFYGKQTLIILNIISKKNLGKILKRAQNRIFGLKFLAL